MFTSPFQSQQKVVFVQDFILNDLVGGAELSMDALHRSSPIPFIVIRSQQLTKELMEEFKHCHWIFGNFAMLDPQLIVSFIKLKFSYSIYEHDYKFCRWRSVERHKIEGGEDCNCETTMWGKLVEAFFLNARQVWFCSQKHMERYFERYPSLKDAKCSVLSAVFGDDFFNKMIPLMNSIQNRKKSGWLTLDSSSWIKGTADAKQWLEANEKKYKLIKNLTPDQVLEEMANAEGFVCLPRGADVSNRMVTEAKLLGCQVVANSNVQHIGEEWLESSDLQYTLQWLYNRRNVFWNRTLELL